MHLHIEQKKAINLNQRLMVTAIIKRGRRYLLVKRGTMHRVQRGKWQFPEGGVEFGERPMIALKRELREETDMKVKSAELLGLNSYVVRALGTDLYHIIRIVYSVKAGGKVKLSGEHVNFGWFTKAQISKMHMAWLRFSMIKKMIP